MGINTFKLTGANVDGENGFIHSDTVLKALPTLMRPLEKRYKMESEIMKKLNTLAKQSAAVAMIKLLHFRVILVRHKWRSFIRLVLRWRGPNIIWAVKLRKTPDIVSWLARHVANPRQILCTKEGQNS